MKPHELDTLIDDCFECRLSEENAVLLSEILQASPEARARYWGAASVHGLLEDSLQDASMRVVTGQTPADSVRTARRFHRRSWAAAVAGVALGIVSASIVWAYAVPGPAKPITQTIPIFADSFENPALAPSRGVPRQANEWSGDMFAVVGRQADVEPADGKQMIQLRPKPTRKYGYAWRIVDLADYPLLAKAESRRLEITASFNSASSDRSHRYQIRLAAFSQEPSAVREIWNDETVLFDTVLQHTGRNMLSKPDSPGWKKVQAGMELPPGTRSVLISIAAGEVDAGHPPTDFYIDDVQAQFVIGPAAVK